jgi:hypothetical protein
MAAVMHQIRMPILETIPVNGLPPVTARGSRVKFPTGIFKRRLAGKMIDRRTSDGI